MHLLLNSAGGIPASQFPAPETPRGGSAVSTFSLLLAGKLAGPVKGEAEIERSPAQSDSQETTSDSDTEALDTDRSTATSKPEQDLRSANQVSDSGTPATHPGTGDLAGEAGPLSGLTGLLFTAETTGVGNGTNQGIAFPDGVPADFRARLAGDIAAGFSNRNGVQTLVLKLDSDHLGQVDVRLQAKGDHLSVRLLAADREAEAALRGNIKELSESIQKRTGRFQHVEVKVELKGGEDLGRETREEDPDHSSGRHAHHGNSGDPDTPGDTENQNAAEVATGPENREQGG